MKTALVLLLSLLSLSIASSASAEDVINAPQWKVGDTCRFSTTDQLKNTPDVGRTRTVSKVAGDTVTFTVSPEDGSAPWETIVTLDGNVISSNEIVAVPFRPTMFFPMKVGTTWEKDYTFKYRSGSSNMIAQYKGRVVGAEQITVPAGTFDTVKIEYSIYYRYESDINSRSGNTVAELWYAPKANCIAQEKYISRNGRGGVDRTLTNSKLIVLDGYSKF